MCYIWKRSGCEMINMLSLYIEVFKITRDASSELEKCMLTILSYFCTYGYEMKKK